MGNYRFMISGCGTAGANVGRAAVADGRGSVCGLYDPVADASARLAGEFAGAETGAEYEQLIEPLEPDAVVVAGPHHLDAAQAVVAAERGCHVLIEKPLATELKDARRIIAAVEANGVVGMTDQTMRYVHPYRQMAQAAARGDIGKIFYIQGDYVHDMWEYYSPRGERYTPWRADDKNPQNILLGGGCHPIDLILWTMNGAPVEAMCYANKLSVPEFPADDCYLVSIRFDDGAIGKVHVSGGCSGRAMEEFLEVYGAGGTLSKGQLHRRGQEPVDLEAPKDDTVIGGHGWGGSVNDFLDTLDGRINNPIPLTENARTVAVCEAALKSVCSGHPEEIHHV